MLIAIEGLTGLGKSTLQAMLSKRYECDLLIQEFEALNLLELFYQDPARYGLEKDLFFLLFGFHQLHHVNHQDRLIVSDFTFQRIEIFARVSLSEEELDSFFLPAFRYLEVKIEQPDLMLYLKGSTRLALERITQRDRKMEQRISATYLDALQTEYDRVLGRKDGLDTIEVSVEDNDFLYNHADVDSLMSAMERCLPSLRSFRR